VRPEPESTTAGLNELKRSFLKGSMKIYTGTGDRGKTSLFSGQRISKANARIEAYGDMDELNSIIGALAANLGSAHSNLVAELQRIQSDLFTISALLATTPDSSSMDTIAGIETERIEFLEKSIDGMEQRLPGLKGFILPGGHATAAWAHIARTVCRRTERRMVGFLDTSHKMQAPDSYHRALIYINRLSDYFFVLARYCNHLFDTPDKLWKK
jgi:cob(I)alamin adenosyltransferase